LPPHSTIVVFKTTLEGTLFRWNCCFHFILIYSLLATTFFVLGLSAKLLCFFNKTKIVVFNLNEKYLLELLVSHLFFYHAVISFSLFYFCCCTLGLNINWSVHSGTLVNKLQAWPGFDLRYANQTILRWHQHLERRKMKRTFCYVIKWTGNKYLCSVTVCDVY
jgi:hypothetical protein